MKFLSSPFGFHIAKLHLVNYKAVGEENQLLRLFILERKMNFKVFFITHDVCCSNKEGGPGGFAPQKLVW